MAIPSYLTASFQHESLYHVICKSLPKLQLFKREENKKFFLARYQYFLSSYVSTYAYCLLENHVHFLISIKSFQEILSFLREQKTVSIVQKKFMDSKEDIWINELLQRQFNSFFVSYTRSFNNLYQQKGHLFDSPFKRIAINDDFHLTQAIVYIHANPLKHHLVTDFTNYRWSSYQSILSEAPTALERHKVLEWFGGKMQFISIHKTLSSVYNYWLPGEIE